MGVGCISNEHCGDYDASGLQIGSSEVLIYNMTQSLKINPLLPSLPPSSSLQLLPPLSFPLSLTYS